MIHFPFAYVGPGAGFAFLGSLLSLLLSLLAGIASLLLWPFRAFLGLFGRKMRARVILLGVNEMAAASGGWSTAAFWKILSDDGVDSTALLIPDALPAKGFKGRWMGRTAGGQIVCRPAYYAKYLGRLLGSLNNPEGLFFSALDHQKRGVLACVFEIADSDFDRIIDRLRAHTDANTTIFVHSGEGILYSNQRLNPEIAGIEEIAPAVLRIFGIDAPEWMEGKPVIRLA